MTLARNIRYLRKKKGWSQEYIATQLGYKSYTTIQKWEMGSSEPPLKKLKELAELFDVDMDDLANKDLEYSILLEINSDPNQQLLIDRYQALPISYQNRLLKYAEALVKMHSLEDTLPEDLSDDHVYDKLSESSKAALKTGTAAIVNELSKEA